MFVLEQQSGFQLLSPDLREKLEKQSTSQNIELKWRVAPYPGLGNFGIYGDVAVGRLVNNVNVIHLNGKDAVDAIGGWDSLWNDDDSKPISKDMLSSPVAV